MTLISGINSCMDAIADRPYYQQVGLAAFSLIGVLIFCWLFILSPVVREFVLVREGVVATNNLIASKQIIASRLEQVVERTYRYDEMLRSFLRGLRDQAQIDNLLDQISGIAGETGVDLKLFQRKEEEPMEFYVEVPTSVVVTGSFHDLILFIDRVSRLPGLVSLNQVSLSNTNRFSSKQTLQAEFNLLAYRALSADEEKRVSDHIRAVRSATSSSDIRNRANANRIPGGMPGVREGDASSKRDEELASRTEVGSEKIPDGVTFEVIPDLEVSGIGESEQRSEGA